MAQQTNSRGMGRHFGICMLAVIVFLIVLMWYFHSHQSSSSLPQRPPGMLFLR